MKRLTEWLGGSSFCSLAFFLSAITILFSLLGILFELRITLPFLLSIPAYIFMLSLLIKRRRREAIAIMLLWAIILGAVMTLLSYLFPAQAAASIINGVSYRDEMFLWLKTGIGKEGTPSLFIPDHLIHLGIFILLSLASGSLLSIALGTVMVDYMAFYVGGLLPYSRNFALTFLLGWHFWSLIRILAYIILGVLLSEPLISRIFKYEFHFREVRRYLVFALLFLIVDIVLKILFAPFLRLALLRLVDLS
jgi:hypothetical protein